MLVSVSVFFFLGDFPHILFHFGLLLSSYQTTKNVIRQLNAVTATLFYGSQLLSPVALKHLHEMNIKVIEYPQNTTNTHVSTLLHNVSNVRIQAQRGAFEG